MGSAVCVYCVFASVCFLCVSVTVCAHLCTFVHVYMSACLVYVSALLFLQTCVSVCVYFCVCLCIFVCVHIILLNKLIVKDR